MKKYRASLYIELSEKDLERSKVEKEVKKICRELPKISSLISDSWVGGFARNEDLMNNPELI